MHFLRRLRMRAGPTVLPLDLGDVKGTPEDPRRGEAADEGEEATPAPNGPPDDRARFPQDAKTQRSAGIRYVPWYLRVALWWMPVPTGIFMGTKTSLPLLFRLLKRRRRRQ